MRKLILITLLLLSITPCLRAQRKQLSQARSYIKSGKDLDKAEKILQELLKSDSANITNTKIYQLWYQALRKQYDSGNEKLYLKQKYDTAAFFKTTDNMFAVLERLDSVDAVLNGNKLKFRARSSSDLNQLRPNLYFGGAFFVRKADYKTAFLIFDRYLKCAEMPMFAQYDYAGTDSKMNQAAYWATYCGYKLKIPEMTLRYSRKALLDTARVGQTLKYMAEAFLLNNDTVNYVSALCLGFEKYPVSLYFYPKLLEYYTATNKLDSALMITDRGLTFDRDSKMFLFAKSSILLNSGRYDECIAVSDSLIAMNDSLGEPHFNAGTAYLNKAFDKENAINGLSDKKDVRKDKEMLKALYRKALPYMEKYRALAPTEKRKWGPALYRIYLQLNMGKQFEEIDKIISE